MASSKVSSVNVRTLFASSAKAIPRKQKAKKKTKDFCVISIWIYIFKIPLIYPDVVSQNYFTSGIILRIKDFFTS